jgi:hypothetical protein
MPRSLPWLVGDDGEMDAGADGDADGRGHPQQLPHVRGQHALLGVSQMLAALRQHVESARDRARRRALYGSAGGSSSMSGRRRASDSGSVTSLSPLDTHNHSTNNVHALSPAVPGSASNGSLSSLLRAAAEQTLRALSPSNTAGAGPEAAAGQPPSTADAVDAGISISSSSPEAWASERARLQRELQQARSEQRFLQEEAAKRDGMLQLLTRGLREVETSQQQWLQEIDTLSKNLDATAGQNKALLEEVGRLRRSLPRRSLSYLLLSFRWGACVPPSRRGKSSSSR